jgi:hypothetical protein
VRHAPRRHRPAFHRPDRHGRPHAHDDGVPRTGADGIQPGRAAGALTCPSSSNAATARCGPNDRPGLGITVDERQLTLVETVTEGAPGATQRRLDGSLTHW